MKNYLIKFLKEKIESTIQEHFLKNKQELEQIGNLVFHVIHKLDKVSKQIETLNKNLEVLNVSYEELMYELSKMNPSMENIANENAEEEKKRLLN